MKYNKNLRTKRSALVRLVASIVRKIKGTVHINCAQPMEDRAILLGIHGGLNGPFVYNSYFERYFVPWGAHEMRGNLSMRWNYLYYVFYRQKCHMSKIRSFVKACILAPVAKLAYDGVDLIGTYHDNRQISAIKRSIEYLDANIPVMIFPENSTEGYHQQLTECHGGFIVLARQYYKHSGIDIPVYPSYLCTEQRFVNIGEPIYVNALLQGGMTRDQVAEYVRDIINGLGEDYKAKCTKVVVKGAGNE